MEFSAGTKKFVLPDAVAKGFLKIEDADTMGSFEKIGLLTERKEKYTREIEMLTTEITRLSQIKGGGGGREKKEKKKIIIYKKKKKK